MITYHVESVLDWSIVVHGAEEVFTEGEDHELLEETISHHELLSGARDVPVVVQNAHASESGDLNLEGNVRCEVDLDHRLARRVSTHVRRALESGTESLVPNLINHYCLQLIIITLNF